MRKQLEERVARLEGSFPDPHPTAPSTKRPDWSQVFAGMEERIKRRKRWLANATAAQLEARLRRPDGVEEAKLRRAEQRIRDGVRWAGLFDTEGIADEDREAIVRRLLSDAGIEIIYPSLRELVKKAHHATMGGTIADVVLAEVAMRTQGAAKSKHPTH